MDIYIGIDDTDMAGTPGTNQLGRRIATALPPGFEFGMLLRHQLLQDERVPFTSQNGSASLLVRTPSVDDNSIAALTGCVRTTMQEFFVPGSDPGFCLATKVPDDVVQFGRRCQRAVVTQNEAYCLARDAKVHLESLGGTGGGVIGALATVGLLAGGDDGRVVHLPGWSWPDPFAGPQPVERVRARGVHAILRADTGATVRDGIVDIGKHLRPAYRLSRVIMYVEPNAQSRNGDGVTADWRAVKLP